MYLGLVLFNLIPVISNIKSGAYYDNYYYPDNVTVPLVHTMNYAVPFDYTTDYRGYFGVFLFNWYIAFICSSTFCIFDLLLLLMVVHLWGHLKILIYYIDNFKTKTDDSRARRYNRHYSDEENSEAFLKLKDIIEYHQFITQ